MSEQRSTVLTLSRKSVAKEMWALALVTVLTGVAFYFRLYSLNSTPPWLWWAESIPGLDVRELLHGHYQILFSRALGREPLYTYLTIPFVAAWDGQPFAVRLTGALLGSLQVPALYFLARSLWRERPLAGIWAGLLAAGAWATSYWAQSINRMGLPVNGTPLLLTLAATGWLNWTCHPTRRRALTFGLLAGLTTITSLAAGVTPFLWLALFLVLPVVRRQALKRSLPWALLTFALVAAPLLFYLARQPGDTSAPPGSLSTVQDARRHALSTDLLLQRGSAVLGAFVGYTGDPVLRNNIPDRTPFSLVMVVLFMAGLLAAVAGLRRRRQQSWLLVLWWLAICIQAVVSASNSPDFPTLLPALPAALLLVAWPVALGADWVNRRAPDLLPRLALVVVVLLVVDGFTTATDYFDHWRNSPGLYTWYQGDVWSLADRALSGGETTVVVPATEDAAAVLDFSFAQAPLMHLRVSAGSVENWLTNHLSALGGSTIKTAVWEEEPYDEADAAQALPFYLNREGQAIAEEPQQGYRIRSYRLGPAPDFEAAGQRVDLAGSFGNGLHLTSARWGAAYPNLDRSGTVATAGTPFWAILGWRADVQLKGKRVALDLVDAVGHRLASADCPLLDAAQEDATSWQPGTALTTYLLVDVPAMLPAGSVSLEVRVYDAQSLETLLPAAGTPRQSIALAQGRTAFATAAGILPQTIRAVRQPASSQLQLLGADPWPGTVAPGQVVTLRLYWRLAAPLAAPLSMLIGLGERGVTAAGSVAAETPPNLPQSTLVDLHVPIDLSSGSYPVWLAVDGHMESQVTLGQVTVAGRPRVFTVPALALPATATFGRSIKLIGMDGPADLAVTAGQNVTVTVAWQALSTPPDDWVRFLHVLGSDGKPVAQADGQPCVGTCPVTSWLPGEIVVEQVTLAVPADLPAGTYPLATGWYDPAAPGMPRLAAQDAGGDRTSSDLAPLPARLIVKP